MKPFLAHTIAVFALIFSSQYAFAAGSISGGGMPGSFSQPAENFSYQCQITYTQETERPAGTYCHSRFTGTTLLKKQSTHDGLVGIIESRDLKLAQEPSRNACKDGTFGLKNSRIVLTVYNDTENEAESFLTSLSVDFKDPYHRSNSSVGISTVPYETSFVETKTRLISEASNFSLTARCKKIVN